MTEPARKDAARPTELGRLFEEAIRCLKGMDFPGANAALKKAHAEAAKPKGHDGSESGTGRLRSKTGDRG